MLKILSFIFLLLCVLASMAFYTILERKTLSYSQSRKGPKKVSLIGLLQAPSDGVKLFLKEIYCSHSSKVFMFFAGPVLAFFMMVSLWCMFPMLGQTGCFSLSVLLFLCISSLNVYSLIICSWSSKSKYSLIGGIRGAAQTISYEVTLLFIFLVPCSISLSLSLGGFQNKGVVLVLLCFIPLVFMWFCVSLAETNRAPFDFAEGESELVSGFKIEFGGVPFVLLFLAEYGNMLLISFMTSILFIVSGSFFLYMFGFFFSFLFLWVRTSYPRFRYDLLMDVAWKVFLPSSLSILMILICLSM